MFNLKKLFTWTILSVLLVTASGCGSSMDEATMETSDQGFMKNEAGEVARDEEAAYDSGAAIEDTTEEVKETSGDDGSMMNESRQLDPSRKYILTYYFDIETLAFDQALNNLKEVTQKAGGYIQNSEVDQRAKFTENVYDQQSARLTIRIPKEKASQFEGDLSDVGNIINFSDSAQDVTGQYQDLDARLKTLRLQEARLLEILEDADQLEYVLELERELGNVRYEIERFESQFRNLDNRISYSTFHVSLYEVIEETELQPIPKTFGEKLSYGFNNTIDKVFNFFENMTLWLLINSPIFVLLAILAGGLALILRRLIRKDRRLRQASRQEVKDQGKGDDQEES